MVEISWPRIGRLLPPGLVQACALVQPLVTKDTHSNRAQTEGSVNGSYAHTQQQYESICQLESHDTLQVCVRVCEGV